MAVANYHEVYGSFPPPFVSGPDGRPWHSWRVLILPYVDQQKLYEEYDFSEPWDGPHNRKLADRMPKLYAFHTIEQPGTTSNYLAVTGEETLWQTSGKVTYQDLKDGSGKTVLIIENEGAHIHWMEPRDLPFSEMEFQLDSPSGISSPYETHAVVMADGSLQRLKPTITPETLRALFTIQGEENVQPDEERGWELLPDGRDRPLQK